VRYSHQYAVYNGDLRINAGKQIVPQSIQSINNDDLELLMELRLRARRRPLLRLTAVLNALHQIGDLEQLVELETPTSQSRSYLLIIQQLDRINWELAHQLATIMNEQVADEAMERDIWEHVTG
jgi:septal ring factor EnvC (AmiA/AmiB activator)